jgi:molybdopterin molybdotransferase
MTGAYLPEGADTVVPVEETNFNFRQGVVELPSTVEVFRAVEPGEYVRVQGEDFKKGQVLIKPGVRLRPQDMGILAMMGKSKVKVYRKPRVAVISTGDELLPVESEIVPGKIRETNSYTLSALIESCGGEPVRLGMVPDEQKKVNAVLDEAVNQGVDLILTSAGVSVGAYDFVKQVVEENGELNFWRVNMRPGKPLAFGSYKDIPYVGLPGNPVSSFAGFEVFLRPTLHFLGGVKDWERITLVAALAEDLTSDGRESYLRARLEMHGDKMVASLTGHQGSGNLHSLVLANGLIIVPAGVKFLPSGSTVTAWLLN